MSTGRVHAGPGWAGASGSASQEPPLVTPSECLRILGLGESASIPEIKRAYHRLALQSHPDRNGGDEAARRRFITVVTAYRALARIARDVEAGREVGHCRSCRQFGEIVKTLDGVKRCQRCALSWSSRLLPMPATVVVRCTVSLLLFMLAGVCLAVAFWDGKFSYATGSFLFGIAGLASLAHTCLTVLHCLPRTRVHAPAQILR